MKSIPPQINKVKIWGTWDNSGLPNSDTFSISILENRTGTPDFPAGVLRSFSGLSPVITPTGNMMPVLGIPFAEYELSFDLPSSVTLAPGIYWLEAYSTGSSGSPDRFAWGASPLDPLTGLNCLAWDGQAPGTSWIVCTVFFLADNLSLWLGYEFDASMICAPAENNSTGGPASLMGTTGSGVGSDLHLECTGGVPSQFGYFLIGTGYSEPGLMISEGRLCLDVSGGNLMARYNVAGGVQDSIGQFDAAGVLQNLPGTATSSGESGVDVPTAIPSIGGVIQAGETWYFQTWYRDNGGLSNFSNAIGQTF